MCCKMSPSWHLKKYVATAHCILYLINAPTCDQVRVLSLGLEIAFMNFIELYNTHIYIYGYYTSPTVIPLNTTDDYILELLLFAQC